MEQEKSQKPQSKKQTKPEPPEQNVYLGDLAPAYIQWYGDNHTIEEFYIKYVKRRNRIPRELQHFFNRNKPNNA